MRGAPVDSAHALPPRQGTHEWRDPFTDFDGRHAPWEVDVAIDQGALDEVMHVGEGKATARKAAGKAAAAKVAAADASLTPRRMAMQAKRTDAFKARKEAEQAGVLSSLSGLSPRRKPRQAANGTDPAAEDEPPPPPPAADEAVAGAPAADGSTVAPVGAPATIEESGAATGASGTAAAEAAIDPEDDVHHEETEFDEEVRLGPCSRCHRYRHFSSSL